MVGFGGVIGSLAGGYLTDIGLDKWCFGIRSILGLLIAIVASTIDKSLERDPDELINASLWNRSKSNLKDVYKGIKLPELWRTLLFFLILGSVVPNFADFLYYYQIKVSGFSQLEYSYLQVLSYIFLILTIFLFSAYLRDVRIGYMMILACSINMLGALMTVLYTLNITFGLKPLVFVCLTSTVTDSVF